MVGWVGDRKFDMCEPKFNVRLTFADMILLLFLSYFDCLKPVNPGFETSRSLALVLDVITRWSYYIQYLSVGNQASRQSILNCENFLLFLFDFRISLELLKPLMSRPFKYGDRFTSSILSYWAVQDEQHLADLIKTLLVRATTSAKRLRQR